VPPSIPDLQSVLTLLGQAQRECAARGDLAAHPLDHQAIWHFHAARVWMAAETLREAVDPPLPPPALDAAATGQDPLALLTTAMQQILELSDSPDDPDELEDVHVWQGRLDTSDALAAVRGHCA
jgi:hypothetical protein